NKFAYMIKTYLFNVYERKKEFTQIQITDSESNESNNKSNNESSKENVPAFKLRNLLKVATK
ncbi:21353_t:CDS:1, partial [Racocetra persica]